MNTQIIKLISELISSVLIIAGFIITIFKPIRKKLADFIVRTSGVPTCDDKIDSSMTAINNLDKALENHIKISKSENTEAINTLEQLNRKLDSSLEAQRNTCRNTITDMYYKYASKGIMPRYKHELLIKTYTNYKSMGGNSFIDELYEEMKDIKIAD